MEFSTIYVDSYTASKKSSKCNNEFKKDKNFNNLHYLEYKNYGFKDDRDLLQCKYYKEDSNKAI